MMVNNLVGGIPTPLKNDGLSNSWDDDIPNMMGKINFMFQTTNQSLINKDPRDAIVVQELCRAAARNNLTAAGAVRLSGSGGQG